MSDTQHPINVLFGVVAFLNAWAVENWSGWFYVALIITLEAAFLQHITRCRFLMQEGEGRQ